MPGKRIPKHIISMMQSALQNTRDLSLRTIDVRLMDWLLPEKRTQQFLST